MAGIEEEGGLRAGQRRGEAAEFLHRLALRPVDRDVNLEAERFERLPHRLGVVRRVRQGRGVLIGAVADDEGHALGGVGRMFSVEKEDESGERSDQGARKQAPT